jgi:hypothetical protein
LVSSGVASECDILSGATIVQPRLPPCGPRPPPVAVPVGFRRAVAKASFHAPLHAAPSTGPRPYTLFHARSDYQPCQKKYAHAEKMSHSSPRLARKIQ